ncbi:hypothetical protein HAX54_020583 [Datura stramonium]|uniref:Uncharacterized protein n=1 Tax=Datura stramonium TaxID=4076 RepID=A0ABS8US50_DATST|nr:hypothetical protein [Datura stramonium]
MFGKGNLFNYLETSGITPSDSKTYTKEDITKAVQKVFTNSLPLSTIKNVLSSLFDPRKLGAPSAFNIYLRCIGIDKQKAYLGEVVLCTTLDGSSFISCPSRSTNCDGFSQIVLPTAKSVTLPRSQEEIYETYPVFA